MSFFKRIAWYAMLLAIVGFFGTCGVFSFIGYQVFYGDTSALEKRTIMTRIKEETTLLYLDEEQPIGSIFESTHRQYVPFADIPSYMLNAIVAAEDKNFFEHFGIDPVSIGSAVLEGVARGFRFRRGGSTITQQTVKNIVNEWDSTFARKFREMIKALQLERLYSKEQILEFYLNQFHVAGNGNGISIAARYYFNKDVQDLDLVEAAFIAGSVKAPSKYNPFIKNSETERQLAKTHAFDRKNYVVGRMLEQGWISEDEHDNARDREVPFNKGEFRTGEVALVELIKSQIDKPEILSSIGLSTIDDLNIAGLKVYTTIDAEFQNAAQLAMRKNLSQIETTLQGFNPEPAESFRPLRRVKVDQFYFGKVKQVITTKKRPRIEVDFGLPKGTIPYESLVRYARLLDLADGKGYKVHLQDLVDAIKPGDILFTQVNSLSPETGEAVLELRKRPDISGGMLAIDKGEVRAVVSGFDTLGFNRAMHARRQPGSAFKSLVFFGALQLGYNLFDTVDNGRQVFDYQGHLYYPRPDHYSPYQEASILWSGVMSENVASVELISELLSKLSFEQFKNLMTFLDLNRRPGEIDRDFHYRVARATGISLDNQGIRQHQLKLAATEMATDLVFTGQEKLATHLRRVWWGNGYQDELLRLQVDPDPKMSNKELKVRFKLAQDNFIRYGRLADQLEKDWELIRSTVEQRGIDEAYHQQEIRDVMRHFRVLPSTGAVPDLGYVYTFDDEVPPSPGDFPRSLASPIGRALNVLDFQAIWDQSYFTSQASGIEMSNVKLHGYLPHALYRQLASQIEDRFQLVKERQDSLFWYFHHYDFRIALGLRYLLALGEACGISSPLDPVLSFPLGTSDVTVAELAKLYQTFIDGRTYRFFNDGPSNQLTFIRRIEDRHGNILYQPEPEVHQLVSSKHAHQMREILRRTVTHGTGRRARGELYVPIPDLVASSDGSQSTKQKRVRIPAFGKTGTTNDHKTAIFAGFLPFPTEKHGPLDPSNSYVIAAYVGYDDNQEMRRGRQRIYASQGALPVWVNFSKEIIKISKYQEMIDPLDLSILARKEWPLKFPENAIGIMMDLPRGIKLRAGTKEDLELWTTTDLEKTGESYYNPYALDDGVRGTVFVPKEIQNDRRQFDPFRKAEAAFIR